MTLGSLLKLFGPVPFSVFWGSEAHWPFVRLWQGQMSSQVKVPYAVLGTLYAASRVIVMIALGSLSSLRS